MPDDWPKRLSNLMTSQHFGYADRLAPAARERIEREGWTCIDDFTRSIAAAECASPAPIRRPASSERRLAI
jgi:hypothetical protein